MATQAQRDWAAKHRAAAAADPKKYAAVRIKSDVDRAKEKTKKATEAAASVGREYRGPTPEQVAAGTLAATPATTEHRKSARTTALTRSGIRAGQTPAQAVAEATTTVYGVKSEQARRAQAILNKQKADIARGLITRVQDLPKSPHDIPLTSSQIHRREQLFEDARRETLLEALKGKSGEIIKYQVIPTEQKARRAFLDLQSAESKLQTNEAQLYLAEQRLVKWDSHIKDGAFVGSEAQYNKYIKDFKSYSKVSNRYDTTYTTYSTAFNEADVTGKQLEQYKTEAHRAKYGGLMGVYETAEAKAAELISAKKAEFKEEYPLTAQRIDNVAAFIKKTSELQVVGPAPSGVGRVTKIQDPMVAGLQLDEQSLDAVMSLSQREFAGGFIQQAGKKPIKTAAMVGVGIITPPVFKGVGAVAKTLGAGRKVAIAGRVGLYGMGGMYVVGTGIKYTQAGTPRERGAVLSEAIFQEILPLFAGGYIGVKAITAAPKVTKIVTRKAGFISREFKAGTKRMLADNKAMVAAGKTKAQRLAELVKSEEARLKRPLLESEYNALEALVGIKKPKAPRTVKTAKDLFKKIDAENKLKVDSGKYTEVKQKDGTVLLVKVVQKPLIKVEQKVLTKQSLKEVVKLKEQFELVTKPVVKPKVTTKPVQKVKVLTDAQKAEVSRLKQLASQRQAAYQNEMKALVDQMPALKRKVIVKTVQKQVLKQKSITKQILELKQQYRQKLITEQVYKQKLAQLNKQKVKLTQQQKQTLRQAQKAVAIVGVVLTPKSISDVTTLIESVQEIKPKEKTKAVLVPKLKPRVAAKPANKIKPIQKVVPEPVPKRVTKPKPPAVRKAPKIPKPLIVPIIKRKAKKKPIKKKPKQYVIYNSAQLINRVATLKSLFG